MSDRNKIPFGALVRFSASVSPTAPKGTVAKWSLLVPGRVLRNLGKSLAITYVAPRTLVGRTITVRSQLTEPHSPSIDAEIDVVTADAITPPNAPVKVELAPGWTKNAIHHGASIDGAAEFLVGRPFTWVNPKTNVVLSRGLTLGPQDSQFHYVPEDDDYADLGHWAHVFASSTDVEGGGAFEAVNSYDSASFTFGLIQFAANAWNNNFHLLLRKAFQRFPEEGTCYFPELRVHGNGVDLERRTDPKKDTWAPLTQEDVKKNSALQQFIKPVALEVTSSEVLFAARMIHWTRAQPGLRKLMVEMAIQRARSNFKEVAKALDGKGIAVCAAVFDVRLQGRGGKNAITKIVKALGSANPLDGLLAIKSGTNGEEERLTRLKAGIQERFKDSKVRYDAKTNELK